MVGRAARARDVEPCAAPRCRTRTSRVQPASLPQAWGHRRDTGLRVIENHPSEDVEWYASHYWGTAFAHFCFLLRRHAELACGVCNWMDVCYWVFLRNQVEEELGENWRQLSFYITLQSGICRGTRMVLDDKALPLTRSC